MAQDHRPLRLSRVPFIFGGMLLVALCAPRAAHAQRTWYATVGAETRNEAGQADAFLPNEIWINAGDSIQWTWKPKNEPHTVTFLRPGQTRPTPPPPIGPPSGPPIGPPFYFGSGSLPFIECPAPNPYNGGSATYDGTACVSSAALDGGTAPSTFTVTFPNPGNYRFVCLIHTNMQGTVHVLAKDAALPYTQSDYDREARDQAEDILNSFQWPGEEARDFPPSQHEVLMVGDVVATGGGRQYLAVVRFFPQTIYIHKGDTVEFTNADPTEPHTVTSGTSDTLPNPMAVVNASPEADGSFAATVNTVADFSNATATTGINSGFLQAAPEDAAGRGQAPPGTTRIRITFNIRGVFHYHCALHDVDGMNGTVVVQ